MGIFSFTDCCNENMNEKEISLCTAFIHSRVLSKYVASLPCIIYVEHDVDIVQNDNNEIFTRT